MYRITVHPGRSLWEELAEQNIRIARPCGGRGVCGQCAVVLRDGTSVQACQYRTAGTVEIEEFPDTVEAGEDKRFTAVEAGEDRRFTAVEAAREEKEDFYADTPVAAMDLGTTTVALTLFWRNRSVTAGFVNPQRCFGADVMSRIRAAGEGHGEEMRRMLMEKIRTTLAQMQADVQGDGQIWEEPAPPCRLVVSANTTMQHLLEGLSCRRLGVSPFTPESLALRSFQTDGLTVVQLPGISAFVGADIVSGLAAIDILHEDAPVLFVDLGTNGELALGCGQRLLVASTAAGPAFEGSAPALKLHGAGLLKLLHELLDRGVMDMYGTLQEPYFTPGYPVDSLLLSQEDIRELQMAKAAVCAGVEMLLKAYKITAAQVKNVYLAGSFGRYLDPEDALAVGLLPEALRGKITAVGNTSLEGAVSYVQRPEGYGARMEEICKKAELVLLPECAGFEERYIERMNFGLYSN
ncbi:MAG: ASKHA domain-containing protein [Muribaculaceae bacterium]|nr:ASKHA domain-containing protein [Muribaculaceae bacterium]MCM1492090.1 ASKHA domain-containing protein [Muribaculaceae bacterium]